MLMVAAALVCALPARAADATRIDALERQLGEIQRQLNEIKAAAPRPESLDSLRRDMEAANTRLAGRLDAQPRASLNNGRLTLTSRDGDFSLSLRSVVHFDAAYFMQGRGPANVDLASGTNFRRAQLAVAGTAWRDWSYQFTYEFGGLSVPRAGYIYRAYIQYDGFKPFGLRIGAFAPPAGLEDATGAGNIVFMERASAANVARAIAGAGGREAVNVFATGERYFLSLAFTGGRTNDAATFDEQQALVGRAAALVSSGELKWVVDANATHVLKVADVAPGPNPPNTFTLSNIPELGVDSVRTVSTGAIDARKVTAFGLESAATLDRFYAQGGWFHYSIARRTALPDPDFSGWYALATWSLTGETRNYDASAAAFRNPVPAHPLGTPGGFGALEAKARYSNIALDYLPGLAPASGGVAGGVQNVWSLGLNWYPTSGLRFMLDYDNIRVRHRLAPTGDITADAIGLRTQISF